MDTDTHEKPRLLVVDDEEPNRLLLDAMLVPQGYEVIESTNGEDALRLIAAGGLDLVLLDVRMPGMDGFEVCRRVRSDPALRFLPIIFVTAVADRLSRIRGKEAGADDFLSKPVDDVELLARVRNLLQVKAYHDLRERQKQAVEEELDRTRDWLIRSERLAILGTLAAGVGHELKNLLMGCQYALERIEQRSLAGQPALPEDIQIWKHVESHLAMHAKHLLHLGRPGPDIIEELDLQALVRSTVAMLKDTGKLKYHAVVEDLGDAPVRIRGSRVRVEQVLVNLLGNAADALTESTRRPKQITIRLRVEPPGQVARCEIEDTGCGIPEAQLARVLEPYYTTKAPDGGTGLGLAVVKSIIESYGGSLSISSREGAGTTVSFAVPVAAPSRA